MKKEKNNYKLETIGVESDNGIEEAIIVLNTNGNLPSIERLLLASEANDENLRAFGFSAVEAKEKLNLIKTNEDLKLKK